MCLWHRVKYSLLQVKIWFLPEKKPIIAPSWYLIAQYWAYFLTFRGFFAWSSDLFSFFSSFAGQIDLLEEEKEIITSVLPKNLPAAVTEKVINILKLNYGRETIEENDLSSSVVLEEVRIAPIIGWVKNFHSSFTRSISIYVPLLQYL